jgi:hypothetical protein
MRFSTSGFFHQTIPSEPLIHGLKPFRTWLRIREIIHQSTWYSGVNDTAVADTADLALQTLFKST